jgi:hypothetical protein
MVLSGQVYGKHIQILNQNRTDAELTVPMNGTVNYMKGLNKPHPPQRFIAFKFDFIL